MFPVIALVDTLNASLSNSFVSIKLVARKLRDFIASPTVNVIVVIFTPLF